MKNIKYVCFVALAAAFFSISESCRKSDNPFDDIVRPTDSSDVNLPFDSTSMTGIYRLILKEKCAVPSCHGGTFEPDFRTPQSSWSTLVWVPVIKNTPDYRFAFRVIPGDFANSWLYERCVTDDPILGRMPRYADALTPRELYFIKKWILDGARDVNGNTIARPNLNARIWDVGAWGPNGQLDTNRTSWVAPFLVPASTIISLNPYFFDSETPVKDLKNLKLLLSSDPNFATSIEIPLTYNAMYDVWGGQFNTGLVASGTLVYMRAQMQDADHSAPAMQPNDFSQRYIIQHFSFLVQ
jgi:hypothetical protein